MKNDYGYKDVFKMGILIIGLPISFITIMVLNVSSVFMMLMSNSIDVFAFIGFCVVVAVTGLFKYRHTVTKNEMYKICYIVGFITITLVVISHVVFYFIFYII